jgi:hypothetical protein
VLHDGSTHCSSFSHRAKALVRTAPAPREQSPDCSLCSVLTAFRLLMTRASRTFAHFNNTLISIYLPSISLFGDVAQAASAAVVTPPAETRRRRRRRPRRTTATTMRAKAMETTAAARTRRAERKSQELLPTERRRPGIRILTRCGPKRCSRATALAQSRRRSPTSRRRSEARSAVAARARATASTLGWTRSSGRCTAGSGPGESYSYGAVPLRRVSQQSRKPLANGG